MAYVQLFPVWAEVNRSAEAGREKASLIDGSAKPLPVEGIGRAGDDLPASLLWGHPIRFPSSKVSQRLSNLYERYCRLTSA